MASPSVTFENRSWDRSEYEIEWVSGLSRDSPNWIQWYTFSDSRVDLI